jgi:predicted metal-dependent peptidase
MRYEMTDQTNNFDLNMHVARLLLSEPFFAAISRRINKRASLGVPTAGVVVNQETAQFEMLYNPNFMSSLTDPERRAVLIHEFYHIIFKHVTDRLPEGGMTKAWNIAADLAINSHIKNLPQGGCIPKQGKFVNFPEGMSAEWYLPRVEELMKQEQNRSQSGENDKQGQEQGQGSESPSQGDSGMNTLDDHSGWGNTTQEIKDIANERLKDIVKQASDEASRINSWGSVSSDVKKEIIESLKTKVDWRKVLRFFVKASQRANKSSTIRRINRRYPYIHAGRKSDRVANIAISIDQSGSVDNEMLAMFFAELNKLSEIASFTVIPFDTEVDDSKVYQWRKGENRKVERVLHGGTCFDAPTEYVNKRDFDGHIVLTDMCAPKPKSSKCQRMWMTTQEYAGRYFETKERVVTVD